MPDKSLIFDAKSGIAGLVFFIACNCFSKALALLAALFLCRLALPPPIKPPTNEAVAAPAIKKD